MVKKMIKFRCFSGENRVEKIEAPGETEHFVKSSNNRIVTILWCVGAFALEVAAWAAAAYVAFDELAINWAVFLAAASSIFLMSRQWPIDDEYLRNSAAGMIHRSAIVLSSLSVVWVLMWWFGL